jgi:hypothetical protein
MIGQYVRAARYIVEALNRYNGESDSRDHLL